MQTHRNSNRNVGFALVVDVKLTMYHAQADGKEWYVNGFVFLCTVSSLASVSMILYSTHVYTQVPQSFLQPLRLITFAHTYMFHNWQFVNCVSDETRIQFCNQFGYVVSILTIMQILDCKSAPGQLDHRPKLIFVGMSCRSNSCQPFGGIRLCRDGDLRGRRHCVVLHRRAPWRPSCGR